jgi:hypothetical protein
MLKEGGQGAMEFCQKLDQLSLVAAVAVLLAAGCASSHGVTVLKQPTTFPIVITQPGSYRVKSNIVVPDANTTAINIESRDVTIDLNGFAILGPRFARASR